MKIARRLFAAASILIGVALLSSDSRAGATVDLLFVARNYAPIAPTDSVGALPGDRFTMAVLLRNDEPITAAIFSLNYDLDGDNELDVVSVSQWIGVRIAFPALDFFRPLGPPRAVTSTFVGSFNSATNNFARTLPPAGGAFAGGYEMGTVVWLVNAGVNDDGADIISGILNPGVDCFGDAFVNLRDARVSFNSATVNLVTEPDTAALLGLGLVGLVLLHRRYC
jgi:hypothetical protein